MARNLVLVVGGSGTVGGAVVAAASQRGIGVLATSRSTPTGGPNLDLRDPHAGSWLSRMVAEYGVTHCVVAAGLGGFAECRDSPIGTRSVNVVGSLRLAENLDRLGVDSLFLSTSAVFGAEASRSVESSSFTPSSEYGRQKAELDTRLQKDSDARILRLTKVLDRRDARWMLWRDSLRQGLPMRALQNVRFAPLVSERVAQACFDMMFLPPRAVRHLSPTSDVSYAEAARELAAALGLPQELIHSEIASHDPEIGVLSNARAFMGTEFPESLGECPPPSAALLEFFTDFVTF